jgi:hypothetical protein
MVLNYFSSNTFLFLPGLFLTLGNRPPGKRKGEEKVVGLCGPQASG